MLKKNIIANYLGQGWTALMGIAFVPLYIKYMGLEAYGLIGFFSVLQAWLALMDMGITPTLTREMARFTAGVYTAQSIRELLRSLEVIAVLIAILTAVLILLSANWLGTNWLIAEKIPVTEVVQAISIMGIVIALRFVESIYRGALLGLQEQVWVNFTGAWLATARSVGAVAILAWVSPTVVAFFIWQLAVSIVAVAIHAIAVHHFLPGTAQGVHFSWAAVTGIRRFAGGMMATTFLVLLLMQVDKVLLSKLLSLEAFGNYMLAASVANALYLLVTPVNQAFYPRFTEFVAKRDISALVTTYHRGAQTISFVVIPSALLLILFGEDVLRLWTGNEALAQQAGPLLALLALGTMLNALMNIPYQLTLAYGWVSFAVWMNVIAVLILMPAIVWATQRYGAVGAAYTWVILNASYLILAAHFIYRKILIREKWHWYIHDVTLPAVAVVGMGGLCWYYQPANTGVYLEVLWMAGSGLAMFFVAGLATPYFRSMIARLASLASLRCPH